jgi:hypothetical protein
MLGPCEICKSVENCESPFRSPSRFVMKILNNYRLSCDSCSGEFLYKDLANHEIVCQKKVCANELCGSSLNFAKNKQTFVMNDEEVITCSKKCKKVAKFSHMIRN